MNIYRLTTYLLVLTAVFCFNIAFIFPEQVKTIVLVEAAFIIALISTMVIVELTETKK